MAGKVVEDVERYCRNCEQRVPPVVRKGAGRSLGILAGTQAGATVVGFVTLFHRIPYVLLTHLPARYVLFVGWPVFVKPAWLGLPIAVVATVLLTIVSVDAGERAKRAAACPTCLLRFDPM
ncbi:hypothetical protein ACFWVC_29855 [Streptomyces sp. NPDC058691]|uniref:hypothetical protein n=1 Tax=Streptomyces sp. NPDC058691 TaxID=3346601 RepID=UPI003662A367